MNILRIDASMRRTGSVTRKLSDEVIAGFQNDPATHVVTRDLSDHLPLIDDSWIGANFTATGDRTQDQRDLLALSDALVAEIEQADTLVIGLPIYNFSVPAAMKAWIDLVARAGLTFKYSEQGPVGLLDGKRAIVVVGSGGTPMESPVDYATDYMKHVLGFIGIKDVTFIDATGLGGDAEARIAAAQASITTALAA